MNRNLRIGGACLNQTPLDWKGNLQNIVGAINEARRHKVDILCLPELCLTGYGCEDLFLSDWLPMHALARLRELLPHTHGIITTIGLPVRLGTLTYNATAVIENTKLRGFYAKHHLANEGVHYEPRWFQSWPYHDVTTLDFFGETLPFGALTLELKGVKTAFEICEDAWHDDRPACHYHQQGVELILNPSASHFAFEKETYRENLVRESSRNFDCTYLYTNLLGNEAGRMIYDGDILIAHKGKLIGHNTRFSFHSHNLLFVDMDFDTGAHSTEIRPDSSDPMEEFGLAVPLALFDYLRKSRTKGFVLSLSGGADSGSIAVLVARMVTLGIAQLGITDFCLKTGHTGRTEKEIVQALLTTAYQGTKNSSKETLDSARYLAETLGATFYQWTIDDQVAQNTKTIETAIGRKLDWQHDDLALQNIQARSRSPLIWMLANLRHSLLLTTSNRSEGDVGYATMDGDTSGSLAPIAAVSKQFILDWLRYAEKELGYHGLSHVNSLQPTAELRPSEMNQTDESDLMPYPVLAAIERLAIRQRKSPKEVYESLQADHEPGQLKEWIRKFFRLWAINQWKRERIAPSFHLDDFNVDPRTWCRFPILSSGFSEELDEL
ncbi:MAG: NAD(+) synthase [Cyclobacteriaceae bacterium]|nr:NAD(+) synthase [Cyclobacteriaceae bacterium]